MGDQAIAQQATGLAVSTAGAAIPLLVSAGWVAAAAVPFIGAGLAVAAALAQYLIKNSGCGQTCIQTSGSGCSGDDEREAKLNGLGR